MIPAYGMAAVAAVYERDPEGPGQAFIAGSSASDYATRELVARTARQSPAAAKSGSSENEAAIQAAA